MKRRIWLFTYKPYSWQNDTKALSFVSTENLDTALARARVIFRKFGYSGAIITRIERGEEIYI